MTRTVLCNARLIDGGGGPPVDAVTLVLSNQIEEIATTPALYDPNANVVNLRGLTVMPGLINAHEHLATKAHLTQCNIEAVLDEPILTYVLRAAKNATILLHQGITTVRECGSRPLVNICLRDAVSCGLVTGPRILACGSPISIPGGHLYRYSRIAEGPVEVRQAVREQFLAGADFIKVHASGGAGDKHGDPLRPEFTVDELAATVKEARVAGRRVAAHAIGREAIQNVLVAGVDSLEHGHFLDRQQAEHMSEKGVFYVPTVSGYYSALSDDANLYRPHWSIEKAKRLMDGLFAAVRTALESGVRIAAGTDSFGQIVDELKLLRSLGLSPERTIMAATSVAAAALGIEDRVGILRRGMEADLIAVEGDALKDLDSLRSPRLVMKGGFIIQCELAQNRYSHQ